MEHLLNIGNVGSYWSNVREKKMYMGLSEQNFERSHVFLFFCLIPFGSDCYWSYSSAFTVLLKDFIWLKGKKSKSKAH